MSDYTEYNSSIETIIGKIIPQLQENFSLIQKMMTENRDTIRHITSPQPYMKKQHIIDTIFRYHPTYDEERVYKTATLDFV
jgi:hypothetical protein